MNPPSRTVSFSKKAPVCEIAGKPPPRGSNIPGVVKKKLKVVRKMSTPMPAPTAANRTDTGRDSKSTPPAISMRPTMMLAPLTPRSACHQPTKGLLMMKGEMPDAS